MEEFAIKLQKDFDPIKFINQILPRTIYYLDAELELRTFSNGFSDFRICYAVMNEDMQDIVTQEKRYPKLEGRYFFALVENINSIDSLREAVLYVFEQLVKNDFIL